MNRISTSKPRASSIALIGFLFATSILQAQVDVGVLGGLNLDRYRVYSKNVNDPLKPAVRVGFHFGAFISSPERRNHSYRGELQYNRRGIGFKDRPREFGWNYDYFDIPLLISFKLYDGLHFDVGPSLALNHRLLISRDKYVVSAKHQVFAVAGVRYAVMGRWELVGRFWYAVTPFEERYFNSGSAPSFIWGEQKLYHQTLQLSMGYKLLPRRQT